MSLDSQPSAAPVPPVHQAIINQLQPPPVFHRDASEDRLDNFDLVADCNGWNKELTLRSVYFKLEDSVKTWFHNHEATLTSGEEVRHQLLADRKEKAELATHTRFQTPNERATTYFEDVDRLFTLANTSMIEEKKVRIVMRDVKQEIFACLVRNAPAILAVFLAEPTAMERALRQRYRQ